MDLERAIETQRDALLRLLARLLFAVDFICCGPVEGRLSRWVCSIVSSVLNRAEMAAGYLVIASARGLVPRGMVLPSGFWRAVSVGDVAALSSADRAGVDQSREDQASAVNLRARIEALRNLLSDVPRHARRLLRNLSRRRGTGTRCREHVVVDCGHDGVHGFAARERMTPRVERPPDTALAFA